jgi:dephospho-CoA kinase
MMASRVRRVALTGGIATGKSHVRARFEALGVPTIDSDLLARDAVATGTPGLAAVVQRFGDAVLAPVGSLARKKLGAIVFADPRARGDLEAIIHPYVREATERWFGALAPAVPLAIADIPLLFEAGRDRDFDEVIVAACEPDTQRQRLMHRDGLTEAEARQRIAAQWPLAGKIAKADYVIRTDGTVEETNRRVDELHRLLVGDHQPPTTNH